MKTQKRKSAFTMIELVFVIVIIGILASVAVPKLAATRDDAEITKARTLVASIRNALAMERQKRILRGEFTSITDLGDATYAFNHFSDDTGDTGVSILEYPIKSEEARFKWVRDNATWYGFCIRDGCTSGAFIYFYLDQGKFKCSGLQGYQSCSILGLVAE